MKTNNWGILANLCACDEYKKEDFRVQAIYTQSDLILPVTRRLILEVNTVIVALTNSSSQAFLGVAQLSPRDSFNRAIGREIAAGRALKTFLEYEKNPIALSDKTYIASDGTFFIGNIPTTVIIDEVASAIRKPRP